jgi:hypothetical protein
MGKSVSCCVGLQSKLQFSNCFLLDGDFKSDVRNGNFVVESALDFDHSINVGIISNVFFDFVYSLNDVFDGTKDALPSHHVTNAKYH